MWRLWGEREPVGALPRSYFLPSMSLRTLLLCFAWLPLALSSRAAEAKPKPAEELQGLVYGTRSPGMAEAPAAGDDAWYRKPALLGWGAVIIAAACYIPFSF